MENLTYRTLKDYVIFKCAAEYEKELFKSYILFIKKTLQYKHRDKVIIDLRNVKGDIQTFDRFELAEFIANTMKNEFNIAILYQKEKINKFAENVAVNRGANFLVSHDIHEIKEWLITA